MRGFAKAIWWGSVAGAALPTFLTTYLAFFMAVDGDGILAALWIAILPLVVTIPIVLAASLTIGLPLTWVLARTGHESLLAYSLAGGAVGLLVAILLVSLDPFALGLLPLGGMSGFVTGYRWWRDARQLTWTA